MISRGFRIVVFNNSNFFASHEDAGVNIATGQGTDIAVRRIFTNRLSPPVGNCLDSNTPLIDWKTNEILNFMYKNFVAGNYYNAGFRSWNVSIHIHTACELENVLSDILVRTMQLLRHHSDQVAEAK
jgi:hypothetical protein